MSPRSTFNIAISIVGFIIKKKKENKRKGKKDRTLQEIIISIIWFSIPMEPINTNPMCPWISEHQNITTIRGFSLLKIFFFLGSSAILFTYWTGNIERLWLSNHCVINNELTARVSFKLMEKVVVHLYGRNGECNFSQVVIYCGFNHGFVNSMVTISSDKTK